MPSNTFPPPSTTSNVGFYSFMGVTKLHRVHREVFTATETYLKLITLMRRSGEDSESEKLRFHGQKC